MPPWIDRATPVTRIEHFVKFRPIVSEIYCQTFYSFPLSWGGVTLRLRQASPLENPSYVVLCTDKGRITRLQDTILERYRRYGPIYRETIAGETVVHLLKPDYIQTVYQNEGKIPYLVPLLETTQMYRRLRQMSPGLGNTYVILYY